MRLARLARDTRGLSTLEYALLFVMIVVAALIVWGKLGDSLETQLDTGTSRLDETLAAARERDGSSASVPPSAAQPSRGISAPSSLPPRSDAAKPGTESQAPAHDSAPGSAGIGSAGDQPEPSLWERTREAVVSSSAVQMGLGIAYGTVQALAPGGFIAPSPAPSSQPFEFGRGAGETATGVVQIVSGIGMLGGGGTTAAAGAVGAPATGGGSLVVSAGGMAVAAEGVAVIGQGLSNVGAGIITLSNAMSMLGNGDGGHGSGGGGNNGDRTRPGGKPDPDAKPEGKRTDTGGQDPDTTRSLQRENDSADVLAKGGYKVEQNPSVPGSRNPDYLIEGKVFDNYAPKTANPRNIWSEIDANKVNPVGKPRQADRIVLNLSDSKVDMGALKKQFTDYPMKDLKEVLVIKDGQILPFWP